MRPYDGLLEDPELQRIVDLQNARNGGALIGLLADTRSEVVARAAFALASVQDSSALPALAELLHHENAQVRADAAFAVGQTGLPRGRGLAQRLQVERDDAVQHELMQALGKVGEVDDLSVVLDVIVPDDLEWSRSLAIARFGMRGVITDESVAHQIDLLNDGQVKAREFAGYYFWRIRSPDAWVDRLDDVRDAFDRIERVDPASGYLAMAISTQGAIQDAERIRQLLASSDTRVRIRALRALGNLSDHEEARSAIFSVIDDANHHVALTAASNIAQISDLSENETDHLLSLVSLETAEEAAIAGHLLTAAARSGRDEAVSRLIAVSAELPAVRRAALLPALAAIRSETGMQLLQQALRSDDRHEAYAAATTLVTRWQSEPDPRGSADRYYQGFVHALETDDVGLIYAVAPVMAEEPFIRTGSAEALASSLRRLNPPEDTEAMLAIINALGRIENADARDALEEAARHPHDVIRQAAQWQLGAEEAVVASSAIRPIDWPLLESLGIRPRLTLETDRGRLVVELHADTAPQTVATIASLAGERLYDGVPFHRVVPDFVIQGGDFARGDGFGGPGFEIRSEFTRMLFDRGVAGMASAGKDTEGSQFFITHSPQPHLDGQYTAFGRVVEGMETVDAVTQGTVIRRATIEH